MIRHRSLRPAVLGLLALGLVACSDDAGPEPQPLPGNPGGFFVEPSGVCLGEAVGEDSLAVYNVGDTTLVVTVVHRPADLTGLPDEITLAAYTGRIDDWTWNPAPPYPVRDSLVLESNDPRRSRVVIPLLRRDPLGTKTDLDVVPPLPGYPPVDTTFAAGDEVPLFWSRHSGCGAVRYTVEVSDVPDFSSSLRQANLVDPVAVVELEVGVDEGKTIHWRARTTAGGITSAWSESRSFFVAP
jgi:hypothetical protein